MKKIICVFAVVLIFVFLCVPAFADSQSIDGYAVDNVPYNESFDGVLTASDSGSQLYSSSENRTYNTSSVLSAPATSSNSVYYYKSVTNFIPTGIWRGTHNPTITKFTNSNGYDGIKYVWSSNDNTQDFYHYTVSVPPFTKLRGGRKYRISFSVSFSRSYGSFNFYLANQSKPDVPLISLFNLSKTINMQNSCRSVSIDFTLPEGSFDVIPVVKGSLYKSDNPSYSGTELTFYIKDFTITDITTEDLDNSIDKGVQKIENAGSDEPPLDTDISAFQSAIDTMNGWLDQLDEFADSIDTAGQTASEYISKGTELFNGFMGIAPASVIALVAFGVVFLVIRKIVGR